jgi:hypothetical protein
MPEEEEILRGGCREAHGEKRATFRRRAPA